MAKLGREARKRRGRAPKEAQLGELGQLLEKAKTNGFILLNNNGLTLAQATALRKKMRENKVGIRVTKNTLLRIGLERAGLNADAVKGLLTGPTVLAVGLEDPVTPAKLLVEVTKDNEKLTIKGGYLEGRALNAEGVKALAQLPGREQLLQRFLGSLMSPAQNFVYAMHAAVAKPVHLLDAIRRQKEDSAA